MLDAPLRTEDELDRYFTERYEELKGLASAKLGFMRRDKEDAVADTMGLAWKACLHLLQTRRDVVRLLGKVFEFSAKRVRSGGRLVGIHPVQDVMSPTCKFRNGHGINTLPLSDDEDSAAEIVDALRDEEESPAEIAAFRVDLEAWLAELDERKQAIVEQLLEGHNTVEVARLHEVSRMRIYQLRCDLIEEWERFNGDETVG